MDTTAVVNSITQNGPWALVAFFLGREILKAWGQDREQLTALIGEFQITLTGLKTAVEHLTEKLSAGKNEEKHI